MPFVKIRRLFGSVPVSASVPVGADARRMLRARQSIGYSVVHQCQIKVKHRFYICQNGLLKFCRINDKNPDKIGVFTGCIYFAALLCLWATKKIFSALLRMNSNSRSFLVGTYIVEKCDQFIHQFNPHTF